MSLRAGGDDWDLVNLSLLAPVLPGIVDLGQVDDPLDVGVSSDFGCSGQVSRWPRLARDLRERGDGIFR